MMPNLSKSYLAAPVGGVLMLFEGREGKERERERERVSDGGRVG
jgi:hypothetical protein